MTPDTTTRPCALPGSPLAQERAGLDACVHCGFCLPACPTYLALDDENDSPRGRLLLMQTLLDGTIRPDDPDLGTHFDQCLGCRGCETACPSGVPYGRLLEATRATLTPHRPLPLVARLILGVFAREWALRPMLAAARLLRTSGVAARLARTLPARLGMPFAMLASTTRPAAPDWTATGDGRRGAVTLLTGCVMEGLFAPVNRATERTLTVNGYRMQSTPGQVCCGALHAHAGDLETARALARANIAAFESGGAAQVVVNSAGCGAMLKEYAHLHADDPAWAARAARFAGTVRDVSELLAAAGPTPAAPSVAPQRVAYDAPCHLQHGQRIVDPPMAVLRAAGGSRLVPLADADQCCGSAGIFNLTQPEVAERVLAPKLRRIVESGAEVVATGNPGCLMQIGGGLTLTGAPVVARHPVELLDADYARGTRRD
jgi:glycolate oxidase iron-sulfur subunit